MAAERVRAGEGRIPPAKPPASLGTPPAFLPLPSSNFSPQIFLASLSASEDAVLRALNADFRAFFGDPVRMVSNLPSVVPNRT